MFTGLSWITRICLRACPGLQGYVYGLVMDYDDMLWACPGLRGYVYGLVLDYDDMFTGLSWITMICLRACPGLLGYVYAEPEAALSWITRICLRA